ncbi:MAG: hypothetical protein Q8P30_01850 [Candidatus Uhrbacteria bacterium]|nr:hypothetical protein [Candidatus Uhrbacteria bacterium]
MTENLATSNQELFEEVVELAIANGVADREAFDQLVETVLEEHREVGELSADQPIEDMEDAIKARWDEFAAELDKRS